MSLQTQSLRYQSPQLRSQGLDAATCLLSLLQSWHHARAAEAIWRILWVVLSSIADRLYGRFAEKDHQVKAAMQLSWRMSEAQTLPEHAVSVEQPGPQPALAWRQILPPMPLNHEADGE
eukprot:2099155-Amphidinium_carterae.1